MLPGAVGLSTKRRACTASELRLRENSDNVGCRACERVCSAARTAISLTGIPAASLLYRAPARRGLGMSFRPVELLTGADRACGISGRRFRDLTEVCSC